jgi:RNA polymerase sigma-70 factor (ECF subfamily)
LEPLPTDAKASNLMPREALADSFPAELLPALRDRDQAALGQFYDSYFDRVYGYVRRMVGEEHLAEDLTQEIMMHIIAHLGSYDPERALRPWVFTIATNKVRDFWRSRQHRANQREVSLDADESGGLSAAPTERPDQELGAQEQTNELTAAIDALPESMRLTLVMRYYEGLSFEAIGEVVGRNETAVRKRYSRALEELRKHLSGVAGLDPDAPDGKVNP